MRIFLNVFLIVTLSMATFGCGGRQAEEKIGNKSEQRGSDEQTKIFSLPEVPQIISSTQQREGYLLLHYWDNFNFSDTALFASHPDIIEGAFAKYIKLLSVSPDFSSIIERFLKEASVAPRALIFFIDLFSKYLYNPNSPVMNETLYIPVLEFVVASDFIDPLLKEKFGFRLDLALKNRPGNPANDFDYTTITNKGLEHTSKMSAIATEYLLLFFNNPGCMECERVKEYIVHSPVISSMLKQNRLKVLSLYSDRNLEEWRAASYPKEWINGYDKECTISEELLYDLKAIPTLYLLDKNKIVILKDARIEMIEGYLYEKGGGRSERE